MGMNYDESIQNCQHIDGWKLVTSFSVGGFEWLGFSKENPNKMIIISSQKTTILDCDNGTLENCTIDYDEEELIAIRDQLPNEHIKTITFILNQNKKIKVYENYGAYICGFSYDGNYFVIVSDGGIIVIKRC